MSPGASRQSTEKCQIGPTLLIYRGNFRGELLPPSSVQYVLTPPHSNLRICSENENITSVPFEVNHTSLPAKQEHPKDNGEKDPDMAGEQPFCQGFAKVWFWRMFLDPQSAISKNPPEFAQPRLSRVKGQVVPSDGVRIWVCLFLHGRSLPQHPHDRPYRNKHTQNCTPSLGTTAPLTLLKRGCADSGGFGAR